MEKIIDSRDNILARIRSSKPSARKLPDIPQFGIAGKPLQNFIAHLMGFDGEYHLFANRDDALDWLRSMVMERSQSKVVFSTVDGVKGTVRPTDFKSPSEMNIVDICIGEALMAIGETGSLLVDTDSLGGPAAALFSTDLYLLIDRNKLVAGLQEAYKLIDMTKCRYSALFSGPSATADVEAVHVTGAQGEISLTAVMYNCVDQDLKDVEEIADRLPQGTPLGQPDAPELRLRRETDPASGQDSV